MFSTTSYLSMFYHRIMGLVVSIDARSLTPRTENLGMLDGVAADMANAAHMFKTWQDEMDRYGATSACKVACFLIVIRFCPDQLI
jgi:hypothetical protein